MYNCHENNAQNLIASKNIYFFYIFFGYIVFFCFVFFTVASMLLLIKQFHKQLYSITWVVWNCFAHSLNKKTKTFWVISEKIWPVSLPLYKCTYIAFIHCIPAISVAGNCVKMFGLSNLNFLKDGNLKI